MRLWNIQLVHNVDEHFVVDNAIRFAQGEMHLPWYNWPAQSLIRINGVIFTLINGILSLFAFTLLPVLNVSLWTTVAHITTVALSILCLLATWNVAFRLTRSSAASILATFFLAISSLHVTHARFATPDMLLTTLWVCGIWIALLWLERTQANTHALLALLSGGLLGIAIATKYTGALVGVPLCVAWIAHHRTTSTSWHVRMQEMAYIAASAVLMHTLFNPFFFQDIDIVRSALLQESTSMRIGADWNGRAWFLPNIFYYLNGLHSWSGTIISWLAYVGLGFFVVQRKTFVHAWLLSLCFVVYLTGISLLGLHWSRWALPLTPLVALAASILVWRIIHIAHTQLPRYTCLITSVFGLFLVGISIPQLLISSVIVTQTRTTSSAMMACIHQSLPPETIIIADGYMFSNDTRYTIREIGIAAYDMPLELARTQGVHALLVSPKRKSDAKKQPELYSHILDRFDELQSLTPLCVSRPTNDDILHHKKDVGVYRWIFTHWNDPLRFHVISGDAYLLYTL